MDIEKVVQNIQHVCREKGTTPTAAGKESGAGKDLVSLMKTRGSWPSTEKVMQMADYLGVTVSELLGEKKEPAPENGGGQDDPLRTILLHNFDHLNQEGREKLVDISDDMVSSGKYIKSDPAGLGKEA